MTPTTLVMVIFIIVAVFAYLFLKLIDALTRIAQRIESTNTHLVEIENTIARLAEIFGTTLMDLKTKQQNTDSRVEDLENDAEFRYDIDDLDPLFEDAVKIVSEAGKASASLIQRRLTIGYARAARILDQLENEGYIGPAHGSSPREVLEKELDEATS